MNRLQMKQVLALSEKPLFELAFLANEKRKEKLKPLGKDNLVTFILDRNITFTDICEIQCDFCAFHNQKGFLLSIEQILEKIQEMKDKGGTQVMLQGGIHPELTLQNYLEMLRAIRQHFPEIIIHSFSPAEIYALSRKENLSIIKILEKMKNAGLYSLPGAAEILSDRLRKKISPGKLLVREWLEVMKSAHQLGMKTTATMTYGLGETLEERIESLFKVRELQDQTNGFKAFIPWSFSPNNTNLTDIQPTDGQDYIRVVALSRLILDNFNDIHAGWVTEGMDLAGLALQSGANDMGGTLMEESVIRSTGIQHQSSLEVMKQVIRCFGFVPALRNSDYEIVEVFS